MVVRPLYPGKLAGRPILTVSTSSLNLMAADCKQDTAEDVAYVAKDPVNQRACHILDTIGQAFELCFKQYLTNTPQLITPMTGWLYYNDVPGKEPPLGELVDMRLREGVTSEAAWPTPPSVWTSSHLGATLPVGQPAGGDPEVHKQMPPPPPCPAGRELFNDPYVNVQNLDKAQQAEGGAGPPHPAINRSAPRYLFDMKPFKDLQGEPSFHRKLSQGEAEALLQLHGDFLVQESQYVLTGLQSGLPKHLLLVDPEGLVWTKDHCFESRVSHLISYHMDNHWPIISVGSELYLQQPVKWKL
uniref:SH2 domain-containing protein n=1 Tax=Nomascus leucogenys TaxID=61853 RepID=A0A2I3H777_NOMLE